MATMDWKARSGSLNSCWWGNNSEQFGLEYSREHEPKRCHYQKSRVEK